MKLTVIVIIAVLHGHYSHGWWHKYPPIKWTLDWPPYINACVADAPCVTNAFAP